MFAALTLGMTRAHRNKKKEVLRVRCAHTQDDGAIAGNKGTVFFCWNGNNAALQSRALIEAILFNAALFPSQQKNTQLLELRSESVILRSEATKDPFFMRSESSS